MEHLRAKLAAGDQAAFAVLYEALGDRLHHYLAVRLGSRPDADDVLQETFARLVRNRHKLREVDNLAAYVFTIAQNEARRLAERKQREASRGGSLPVEDLFDEACSADLARRELAGTGRPCAGRLAGGTTGGGGPENLRGSHLSRDRRSDRASPRDGGHARPCRVGESATFSGRRGPMNDDVEWILNGLMPRGAAAELRDRVLRAVAAELVAPQRSPPLLARRDVRAALAMAALLLVGVLLNVWVIRSDDARQARLYGAGPLPRAIHETVQMAQHAAGPACAELIRQQLVAAWQSRRRSAPWTWLVISSSSGSCSSSRKA